MAGVTSLIFALFVVATQAQIIRPGIYHTDTANTCMNPITDMTECQNAAKTLHSNYIGTAATYEVATGYPYGCYMYISDGSFRPELWFNNNTNVRSEKCTSKKSCVCKGDSISSAATPGLTTTHVTTGNHANCLSAGKQIIHTKDQCSKSANAANLGKTFTTASVTPETNSAAPKGCYVTSAAQGSQLMLNTYTGSNTQKCGANGIGCLCVNTLPMCINQLTSTTIEQFYVSKFGSTRCDSISV